MYVSLTVMSCARKAELSIILPTGRIHAKLVKDKLNLDSGQTKNGTSQYIFRDILAKKKNEEFSGMNDKRTWRRTLNLESQ